MIRTTFAIGAASLALLHPYPAYAEKDGIDPEGEDARVIVGPTPAEPILVTASRGDMVSLKDFTGSATQIGPGEIEDRQIRNIADALRDVPSAAVAPVAGQTQIRLRGSEANHVLVLVDGIELSDPGSGEYDIGTLQAEIGSRLEVLRGPQSALYGNDALSGVVAYRTASGGELEGLAAFAEGGTNGTFNASARYGLSGERADLAVSGLVVSTDGEPNARGGIRDIGRDSYTGSAKGSFDLSERLTLRAVGRFVRSEGEFNDQQGGILVDSPGNTFESEALSGLIGARFDALGGKWTHDVSVQFTDASRRTLAPQGFPSDTESDRVRASYVTTYDFAGSPHELILAADYEVEGFNNLLTFDDRKQNENFGLVGEYRHDGALFDFAAALRHDINELFGDTTTFRAGAGYALTDTTRLRAAAGSGVKNPTLNELFGFFDGVFVGNEDLVPEQSTSYEFGIDQTFEEGAVTISATYFRAELENEIFLTFPPPSFIQTPRNRETRSERRGIELALSASLGGGFSFDGAYSFLDATEDGAEEIRRPDHLASAVLNWTDPRRRASANIAVRHTGEALDRNFATFPATLETLDAYTLVNLNARVQVAQGSNLFGRIENLLDERYEPVFSFVAPGLRALAGFETRF